MTTGLAIPTTDGPNYAPVQPLQRYLDQGGKEQKPFPEWLKLKTGELERLEQGSWTELALVWQLMNMMINGDQLAVRGHRSGTWTRVPMPTTTTAPVRQQNKLGFYSRVLMAKEVSAKTKLRAVAGDDSDQSAGAVRAAQIFADVIQPIVYTELFRQQEALAGMSLGTRARYFFYDEEADGGVTHDPITEQREFTAGGGIGSCYECGYAGSADEFGGVQPNQGAVTGATGESFAGLPVGESDRAAINAQFGHDEVAEWEQGLEAPHAPELEPYEEDEQQHLAAAAPMGNGLGNGAGYGADGTQQSMVSGVSCPACGSLNVEVEPPQVQTLEVVTGTKVRKLGQMRAISVPYTQLRHEISTSLEESPWMRWKRRCRIEELKAKFPNLKITPVPNNNQRDPGLATEDALRRSVAQTGANRSWTQTNNDQYTNFTQWWLTPAMYADYVFPTPVETVAGEQIPQGAKASELFPDGMYIAMVEGVDAPVQIRNESHKWHWITAPYRLQMFSGLGIGINDAVEMQRQWNVTLSLIFEQIRSTSLPGWLYDKDAVSPDDVRLLGQPQNNVPVSTRNREGVTRLEQLVHQMNPGQLPGHIPWYVGQLDANMQTASGALVNEGVPGTDSKTATGANLMNNAANQHNTPEYALKGDADLRSMMVLFELAKKHYVEPRYLPLSGKNGKQDGIWLSNTDFANGQIRWEIVGETYLPSTRLDKEERFQKLLMAFGGPQGLAMAKQMMPSLVYEMAEILGIYDLDDEYASTTVLCRQRLDQVKEMAEQSQGVLMQMQQLTAMAPELAMTVDPMTGMVSQIDPTEQFAQQIVQNLQPPPRLEEPGHKIAMDWYRQVLIDDEIKEADPLTQACVVALIRMEAQFMGEEGAILGQMAQMAQPQPPMEEQGGQKPPEKTDQQKRDASAKGNMGDGQKRPSPRPQPAQMAA